MLQVLPVIVLTIYLLIGFICADLTLKYMGPGLQTYGDDIVFRVSLVLLWPVTYLPPLLHMVFTVLLWKK